MRNPIQIENIEEMRLREGIDDIELRAAIRGLKVGDLVKLTLLVTGTLTCETVLVRITSIRGPAFRGKLVRAPLSSALSKLRVRSPVDFSTAHIHSIPKTVANS